MLKNCAVLSPGFSGAYLTIIPLSATGSNPALLIISHTFLSVAIIVFFFLFGVTGTAMFPDYRFDSLFLVIFIFSFLVNPLSSNIAQTAAIVPDGTESNS